MCWPYPFELPLDGGLLVCGACGAERDWLLILQLRTETVSVRCRCTNEWREPRIPAGWYRQHCGELEQVDPHPEVTNRALGFDGTFASTYL
ncbi:hypothetical protein [Streptomyces litchfieldiae]|uniref:Uncharacterized protein n=1 Tax=Streptomyces litchfieldiae TaxID=3075543 RepID=A0ABU2N2M1_9ACTN|nr:hypothetical protein [Streptomyces sp. DSM 44938]MDT0347773.1 hypothetical protein [Streptomyces sp. DSM 44938]